MIKVALRRDPLTDGALPGHVPPFTCRGCYYPALSRVPSWTEAHVLLGAALAGRVVKAP
jgi:hypothetical protein